jgi:anthraniloyl-CoA monooxygenase
VFQPDIVTRPNRYIWLGTTKLFDAFNFLFEKTEHGWFQAHVYKFDDHHHHLHHRDAGARLEGARPGPGRHRGVIAFCEKLFAHHLDGHALLSNARHLRGSAWLNFQRVRCRQWHLLQRPAAMWC